MYIWVTFLSLRIVHKNGNFFREFEAFCGNFKHGNIKTETLFLDNFVGTVRICNFFLIKVILQTPWGARGQGYTSAMFNNLSLFRVFKKLQLLSNSIKELYKCKKKLVVPP